MTRRRTLLIIGCGDVGLRVARLLAGRWRILALSSSPQRLPALRAAGVLPLLGDLDRPETLGRLAMLSDAVLHLAPPPAQGETDPRTRNLLRVLARGGRVARLVYASTTGVYGDCQGDWIDETRTVAPITARARRRVDAEALLRFFGRHSGATVSILRVPGIYAPDREGGHPRERVARGSPVLQREDDVFTNHIHADDLARACVLALHRGRPQRSVNVCDDSALRMGDHYDRVADLCGLARPPRLSREQAQAVFSAMQWSFMNESRRIGNHRLKQELGLALRYPGVEDALRDAASAATPGGPAVAGDTPGPISGTLPGRA
ncbi:MAG: SDR family oxidoreductase [Rubrivivax sp.]|nr:SDR family oxidoreductase [Rubrivivax sp.]